MILSLKHEFVFKLSKNLISLNVSNKNKYLSTLSSILNKHTNYLNKYEQTLLEKNSNIDFLKEPVTKYFKSRSRSIATSTTSSSSSNELKPKTNESPELIVQHHNEGI